MSLLPRQKDAEKGEETKMKRRIIKIDEESALAADCALMLAMRVL